MLLKTLTANGGRCSASGSVTRVPFFWRDQNWFTANNRGQRKISPFLGGDRVTISLSTERRTADASGLRHLESGPRFLALSHLIYLDMAALTAENGGHEMYPRFFGNA